MIWDMQYPGPWDSNARRSGRGGPLAPPGTYTIRLSSNGVTQTRQLVLNADPRVTADGVTTQIMREQVAHNIRVRDLVTDVNHAVADLADLKKKSGASPSNSELRKRVDALDRTLITPPIRYSRPGLQSQIQYLYFGAMGADQKVGRDMIDRYSVLRKELNQVETDIVAARKLVQ